MLKKIIIEKLYIVLTILVLGLWGALNMLQMEHDSFAADGSPLIKALQGVIFVLVSGYLLVNYRYVKLGRIGERLFFLCIYMSLARLAILPFFVSSLSYVYQPMKDLTVVLLFLFSYTISYKSEELHDFFSTWIIVGMLVIAYFYLQNWRFVNAGGEYHMGSSYWVLFLLPVLLYTPHKWLRYAGLVLVGTILFASFKRGGILAFGCGLFAYLFVKEILIGRKISKMMYFIIALIALALVFLVVDNAMDNVFSERFLNIKNDGGSNRDQVWAISWQQIKQSDFEHLLFGHGFCELEKYSPLGMGAHNDFLESLFDFGIVGTLFYVILHISLIRQIFRNIRLRNKDAAIMAFTYAFFIILAMVSFVQIYPWFAFMALSWGLGCASERKILSV